MTELRNPSGRSGPDGPGRSASTRPWGADEWLDDALADAARPRVDDPVSVLDRSVSGHLTSLAAALGHDTWTYLAGLATLGSVDLSVARAAEPHVDALAILAQAGGVDLGRIGVGDGSTFGVFAAEAPGRTLVAEAPATSTGPVTLRGEKPWCSLAATLTHALVTATATVARPADGAGASAGQRGLFAVDLRDERVELTPKPWVPRGLTAIATHTLAFEGAPAVAVGGPGWYLSRPGFAWGGIGVAAVWFGAAAALAASLVDAARRREPDQIALMHVGRVDRVLTGALLALRAAAADIDAGRATGAAGELLAARVRAVLAQAAEDVIEVVGHALGPAPLTHDETHARRVADLTVYVRQHHAERDLARLGGLALAAGGAS